MKQAILNSYQIADYIRVSHDINSTMRATVNLHEYICMGVKLLVGDEVFDEANAMAKRMIAGEVIIRSKRPRVFEVEYKEDGSVFRKFFSDIEKAEGFAHQHNDVSIVERFID